MGAMTKLGIIGIYAIIFYITYYGLMPLFFKKKTLLFLCLTMVTLGGALVAKKLIMQHQMEHDFKSDSEFIFEKPAPQNEVFDSFENKPRPNEKNRKKPPNRIFDGRNLIDISSLFLFFVMGVSLRFIKKWQDDEEWKSHMEKQKVQTELEYLKQQINPHFLFNSLNSIYSLALTKSEITTDSILKLSSILRYMLYESEDSLVMLRKEIDTVHDYIDLQRLRLTELVEVHFETTGQPGNYKIAPFILIPIIENAFKYGSDNVSDSFIHINIVVEDDQFAMTVQNKIVSTVVKKEVSGIGLKNIERRLELLYPNEHGVHITNENGVYSVTLHVKLRK